MHCGWTGESIVDKKITFCMYEALIEKYLYDRKVIQLNGRYFIIKDNKRTLIDHYLVSPDSVRSMIRQTCGDYQCDMFLYLKKDNWVAEFYSPKGTISIAEAASSTHAVIVAMLGVVKGMKGCAEILDNIKTKGFNWDLEFEDNLVDVDFKNKKVLGKV
jgi:hypothetical protein